VQEKRINRGIRSKSILFITSGFVGLVSVMVFVLHRYGKICKRFTQISLVIESYPYYCLIDKIRHSPELIYNGFIMNMDVQKQFKNIKASYQ